MTRKQFEQLVKEEFPKAITEKFLGLIANVAFLVEDEPDEATRAEQGLAHNETLLGLYSGVPATARGDFYGVGATLPDTITLYQLPIEEEAEEMWQSRQAVKEGKTGPSGTERTLEQPAGEAYTQCVRRVIRETIWHEVAHHFGYDEDQVHGREEKTKNAKRGKM